MQYPRYRRAPEQERFRREIGSDHVAVWKSEQARLIATVKITLLGYIDVNLTGYLELEKHRAYSPAAPVQKSPVFHDDPVGLRPRSSLRL